MSNPIEKTDAPAGQSALVAKMAEVFSAEQHLSAAVFSLREWFHSRKPGEDFGLRLLDCQMWAANLEWLLVQAAIIVKGEEEYMQIDYEVQSAVAVSLKNDRILIEVRRSDNNPPFSLSLSLGSARNLALIINAKLRESGN